MIANRLRSLESVGSSHFMTQLAIVFLITLLVAIGFYVYFYAYLRGQYKSSTPSYNAPALPIVIDRGPKDLREMAQMLDPPNPKNAKLVIEQLSYRKQYGKEFPDILAIRIQAYYQRKDYQNALKSAMELSQQGRTGRFMTADELIEYLALIYAGLGHHEKAYNEYIILTQKYPENIEYLYEAANQALEMGQYTTASILFEKALNLNSNHLATLAKLGRIYCEKRLYTQALDFFNKAYSQNYNSDEMRYYLAIALIHTSGQEKVAFSLLQRISEEPKWSKKALPRLAKLGSKLGNHKKVISIVDHFRNAYGKEVGEGLLSELAMMQAQAYRELQEFDKACAVWGTINVENAHYEEAQSSLAFCQLFSEPGLYQDYLNLPLLEFVDLCYKICTFIIKRSPSSGEKKKTPLEKRVLNENSVVSSEAKNETVAGKIGAVEKIVNGALIIERRNDRWDPTVRKLIHVAPNIYIFPRLDQDIDGKNLRAILHHLGIDKNYEKVANIHIYSLHLISKSNFDETKSYNLFLHKSEEFRELLEQIQET